MVVKGLWGLQFPKFFVRMRKHLPYTGHWWGFFALLLNLSFLSQAKLKVQHWYSLENMDKGIEIWGTTKSISAVWLQG